ncbi:MAG: iron ABC transporter permease [Fimbriimonadaceae bacterium]|nr:MAG: iron ABC transporter permease [Fimbriimonadaceae bacterium]
MNDRSGRWILGGCIGLIVACMLHLLFSGGIYLPAKDIFTALIRGDQGELAQSIVWKLRLPRLVAGIIAGSGLAVVGSVFQMLFRNPLAEPYVIGVSSGAGVGGSLMLSLGLSGLAGGLGVAFGGVIGAIVALMLVFLLSSWRKQQDVVRLILAGVVVGAMLAGLTTLVLLTAGKDSNVVLRWLLGSLTPMSWPQILIMLVLVVITVQYAIREARKLNSFAFGGDLAKRLGVDSRKLMTNQLAIGSVAVGAIVGCVGIIGFVGLIAPHIARNLVGPDLRRSLPVSAFLGAILLVMADLLAQKIIPGGELPVGAVMAILGSPILLVLLRKSVYRFVSD